MMFNYDAESNAATILRAMQRETVPARSVRLAGTSVGQEEVTRLAPPPRGHLHVRTSAALEDKSLWLWAQHVTVPGDEAL